MTLYENKITRDSSLDKKDGIQAAYEKMLLNEAKVEYKSIKSPKKPFFYKGKWYTRDEMKKMGLDKEASKAILKENYEINEASLMTVDEFTSKLESTVKKIFPKSLVRSRASTNLGSSISLVFALGKDKSEWTNGIIENDVLFHRFMIGWNSFTEGHFIKDKIQAELSTGGGLKVDPDEGSYMAFDRVKIGWRKKTAPPDKIIAHFGNYFKKARKVLTDNKDRIPQRDLEIIGKKI